VESIDEVSKWISDLTIASQGTSSGIMGAINGFEFWYWEIIMGSGFLAMFFACGFQS
jgi:hypothetical protein